MLHRAGVVTPTRKPNQESSVDFVNAGLVPEHPGMRSVHIVAQVLCSMSPNSRRLTIPDNHDPIFSVASNVQCSGAQLS